MQKLKIYLKKIELKICFYFWHPGNSLLISFMRIRVFKALDKQIRKNEPGNPTSLHSRLIENLTSQSHHGFFHSLSNSASAFAPNPRRGRWGFRYYLFIQTQKKKKKRKRMPINWLQRRLCLRNQTTNSIALHCSLALTCPSRLCYQPRKQPGKPWSRHCSSNLGSTFINCRKNSFSSRPQRCIK